MTELLLRFLIGGTVVAAFSVIGDLFKPESFGGLGRAVAGEKEETLPLKHGKGSRPPQESLRAVVNRL